MGIISVKHSSNLFWLGRYIERVYTTLVILFNYYDTMLDKDKDSYKKFLEILGIEDNYGDYEKFIQGFLYGEESFSLTTAFRSAHDNALVLRNMIGSESLAYIDLASGIFHSGRNAKNLRLVMMPAIDYILAFWGCIDDKLYDQEARNIIKCGKLIERLDIYFRFSLDYTLINSEFEKLCHIIGRMRKGICDTQELAFLVDILSIEDNYKDYLGEVLASINKLFEGLPA
jgi:uncharacterized alpha-E superfamily protein